MNDTATETPVKTRKPRGKSPATTALVTIDPENYVTQSYETFTKAFDNAVKAIATIDKVNVSTKEGMEIAKTHRAIFRGIRIDIDKKRAECKAPILEIGRLLDSRAKEVIDQVRPYEEKFDAPIKAEEQRIADEKAARIKAEAEAAAAVQREMDRIKSAPLEVINGSSDDVTKMIGVMEETYLSKEFFGERIVEAEYALKATLDQLATMRSGKQAQEQLAALQEQQRIKDELAAKQQAAADALRRKEEDSRLKEERERMAKQQAEIAEQQAEIARQREELEAMKRESEARKLAEEQQKISEAEKEVADRQIVNAVQSAEVSEAPVEIVPEQSAVGNEIKVAPQGIDAAVIARPSDDEIIEVLSLHYRVHELSVIAWLMDMNLEDAGIRASKDV